MMSNVPFKLESLSKEELESEILRIGIIALQIDKEAKEELNKGEEEVKEILEKN